MKELVIDSSKKFLFKICVMIHVLLLLILLSLINEIHFSSLIIFLKYLI